VHTRIFFFSVANLYERKNLKSPIINIYRFSDEVNGRCGNDHWKICTTDTQLIVIHKYYSSFNYESELIEDFFILVENKNMI
jgi:hypothetical protein